ncbi:DgyrCDS3739 [Dimorphilus gyrociliatus]|uniref:DgyrCDS3739 n=1 Tax=Dimorphilus gyrociliatus TaxID=2664684 RepID=A0A7I8VEK5_9ANNE|nr:DgyrCDS3739 [Dimorphilus gyrociliatus]
MANFARQGNYIHLSNERLRLARSNVFLKERQLAQRKIIECLERKLDELSLKDKQLSNTINDDYQVFDVFNITEDYFTERSTEEHNHLTDVATVSYYGRSYWNDVERYVENLRTNQLVLTKTIENLRQIERMLDENISNASIDADRTSVQHSDSDDTLALCEPFHLDLSNFTEYSVDQEPLCYPLNMEEEVGSKESDMESSDESVGEIPQMCKSSALDTIPEELNNDPPSRAESTQSQTMHQRLEDFMRREQALLSQIRLCQEENRELQKQLGVLANKDSHFVDQLIFKVELLEKERADMMASLEKYFRQLENEDDEKRRLKELIKELEGDLNSMNHICDRKSDEMNELIRNLERLAKTNDELQSQLSVEKGKDYEAKYRVALKDLDEKRRKLQEFEDEIIYYKNLVERSSDREKDAKNTIVLLERNVKDLEANQADKAKRIDRAEEEYNKLLDKYRQDMKEKNSFIDKIQDQSADKLNDSRRSPLIRDDVTDSIIRPSRYQSSRSEQGNPNYSSDSYRPNYLDHPLNSTYDNERLSDKVRRLDAENDTLRHQLKKSIDAMLESERKLRRLPENGRLVRNECEALRKQLDAFRKIIYEATLALKQTNKADPQGKFDDDAFYKHLAQLEEDYQKVLKERERTEFLDNSSNQATDLHEFVEFLNNEVEKLEREKSELVAKKGRDEELLDILRDKLRNYERKMNDFEGKTTTSCSLCDHLMEQREELKKELNDAKDEINNLKQAKTESKANINNQLNNGKTDDNEIIRGSLHPEKSTSPILPQTSTPIPFQEANNGSTKKYFNDLHDELVSEVELLQKHNEFLTDEVRNAHSKIQGLVKESEILKVRNSRLDHKLKQSQTNLDRVDSKGLIDKEKDLILENTKLRQVIRDLKQKENSSRPSTTTLENINSELKIDKLTNENDDLKVEVKTLTERLHSYLKPGKNIVQLPKPEYDRLKSNEELLESHEEMYEMMERRIGLMKRQLENIRAENLLPPQHNQFFDNLERMGDFYTDMYKRREEEKKAANNVESQTDEFKASCLSDGWNKSSNFAFYITNDSYLLSELKMQLLQIAQNYSTAVKEFATVLRNAHSSGITTMTTRHLATELTAIYEGNFEQIQGVKPSFGGQVTASVNNEKSKNLKALVEALPFDDVDTNRKTLEYRSESFSEIDEEEFQQIIIGKLREGKSRKSFHKLSRKKQNLLVSNLINAMTSGDGEEESKMSPNEMSVTVAMQVDEENPLEYNHTDQFDNRQSEVDYDEYDNRISSPFNNSSREFNDKIIDLQRAVKQLEIENRHLEDGLSRRDEHIDDLISQIRRYDELVSRRNSAHLKSLDMSHEKPVEDSQYHKEMKELGQMLEYCRQEKNELLERLQGNDMSKRNVGTTTWNSEPRPEQDHSRNNRLYGLLREKNVVLRKLYIYLQKIGADPAVLVFVEKELKKLESEEDPLIARDEEENQVADKGDDSACAMSEEDSTLSSDLNTIYENIGPLFIATKDYNPSINNKSNCLNLKEGDIVHVLEKFPSSNFYKVKSGTKVGLAPKSHLSSFTPGPPKPPRVVKNNVLSHPAFKDGLDIYRVQSLSTSHPAFKMKEKNKDGPYEEISLEKRPYPPKNFKIEKIFKNSIILSWKRTKVDKFGRSNGMLLAGYEITLPSGKTRFIPNIRIEKALVENEVKEKPRSYSIRTVTERGKRSEELFVVLESNFEAFHTADMTDFQTIGSILEESDLIVPRIAIYDYNPINSHGSELVLKTGDLVLTTGEEDETGYFKAQCKGKSGIAPACFLEEIAYFLN